MLEAAVVHVADRRARRTLVDGVSLTVDAGEAVVILGETGAGTDVLVRLLVGRLRRREQVRGSLLVDGVELVRDGRLLAGVADDLDLLRTGWTPDLPERLRAALAQPGLLVVPDVFERCSDEDVATLVRAVSAPREAALLLVTSDPRLAFAVADHITVMYAGCPVESGPAYRLLATPAHPYTRALIDATATVEGPPVKSLPGTAPTASAAALQCVFAERCEHTRLTCWWDRPLPRPVAFGHSTACARHRQLDLAGQGYAGGQGWLDPRMRATRSAGESGIVGLLAGRLPAVERSTRVLSHTALARERRSAGDLVVAAIGGAQRPSGWTADECREDVMGVLGAVGLPRRVAAVRARDLPISQRIPLAIALALLDPPSAVMIDNDVLDVTARPSVWEGARLLAAAGCAVTLVSARTADLSAAGARLEGQSERTRNLRVLAADWRIATALGLNLATRSLLDDDLDVRDLWDLPGFDTGQSGTV